MLTVSGLYKRWGPVQALDGFDLHIEPGEICGLIGHNGAGKTTFARTVAGLERPDAGSVLVAGVDLATAPRSARSLIGLAPQESALYPTATLRQNLRLFGGLAGLHRTRLSTELAAVAEELVLTDVLDRPIATLSGGQQRRAQAATVLLPAPACCCSTNPPWAPTPPPAKRCYDSSGPAPTKAPPSATPPTTYRSWSTWTPHSRSPRPAG